MVQLASKLAAAKTKAYQEAAARGHRLERWSQRTSGEAEGEQVTRCSCYRGCGHTATIHVSAAEEVTWEGSAFTEPCTAQQPETRPYGHRQPQRETQMFGYLAPGTPLVVPDGVSQYNEVTRWDVNIAPDTLLDMAYQLSTMGGEARMAKSLVVRLSPARELSLNVAEGARLAEGPKQAVEALRLFADVLEVIQRSELSQILKGVILGGYSYAEAQELTIRALRAFGVTDYERPEIVFDEDEPAEKPKPKKKGGQADA